MIIQPAKDDNCNGSDVKSGSEPGPASKASMDIDTNEETDRLREKGESEECDKNDSPESL